jgi:divalent metal cation (Fe/Co/Zn/Cd) transporter
LRAISAHEFPPEIEKIYRRPRLLEWITLGYVATSSLFLFLTMGTSQAMRTSFFEDVISAVPAIVFLVCTRIALMEPTTNYP